ncbi:DUF5996 family protein [Sphingosinicella sp. YJ22]|uniref:DUF5996 family protein n=1 Tax=Sphingosinicella sp. YJ22 TaxID=1104780 RepID=UPI00140723F4|nr:DUF5996 family protein [Sphingosinicella sp. YJ22]
MSGTGSDWPSLSDARDRPTIVTLHLVSQVVGKVPTALLPWRNHGWHLTLRVTSRGLRSEPLYGAGEPFELMIDLVSHRVCLIDGRGESSIPLKSTTMADFHAAFMTLLAQCGREVAIHPAPNEVEPATPFAEDRAPRAYSRDSAERLHGALLASDRVFKLFRSGFLGKVSPVHFFWGSFDLAVTRFSGRPAPLHPGGIPNLPDSVTREAYSHEVSSAGFWPGGAGAEGGPFFYSYAYPTPDGFADAPLRPNAARFDTDLGEFVLDYEAVRRSEDPDAALLAFLTSTYEAAANLAKWDRAALECDLGRPRIPRPV